MPNQTSRLHIIEPEAGVSHHAAIRRAVAGYPFGARVYSRLRFKFIPPAFLDTIEQHLPESGTILDLGCGMGMFTLYFAQRRPDCRFLGVDLDAGRIAAAARAASAQGIDNVEFIAADLSVTDLPRRAAAAYCIDILHHLPQAGGDRLVQQIYANLEPGGVFILKDLTTRPRAFLYLAFLQDTLMYPNDTLCYRSARAWQDVLGAAGFSHPAFYPLNNLLPYPHFVMVATKPSDSPPRR